MQAAELQAATSTSSTGELVPMRTRADIEKAKLKTNKVKVTLTTASRKRTPMMRGVSCALASCTTRSNDEHTNTMKVKMAPASVPRTERTESGLYEDCQPRKSFRTCNKRTRITAITTPRTGRI